MVTHHLGQVSSGAEWNEGGWSHGLKYCKSLQWVDWGGSQSPWPAALSREVLGGKEGQARECGCSSLGPSYTGLWRRVLSSAQHSAGAPATFLVTMVNLSGALSLCQGLSQA